MIGQWPSIDWLIWGQEKKYRCSLCILFSVSGFGFNFLCFSSLFLLDTPYVPSYMNGSEGADLCVVCSDAATGYHYRADDVWRMQGKNKNLVHLIFSPSISSLFSSFFLQEFRVWTYWTFSLLIFVVGILSSYDARKISSTSARRPASATSTRSRATSAQNVAIRNVSVKAWRWTVSCLVCSLYNSCLLLCLRNTHYVTYAVAAEDNGNNLKKYGHWKRIIPYSIKILGCFLIW